MDLKQLAFLVSQWQPLWDRNHEKFRDKGFKAGVWVKIARELNTTDVACKVAYKSLREKYLREREKQCNNYGQPWELLEYLHFLDPYITTRRSGNANVCKTDNSILTTLTSEMDPLDTEIHFQEDTDDSYADVKSTNRHFTKSLIKMVHQCAGLWNRNHKCFGDKPSKDQLWTEIATSLQSDVTTCSLKWKSLREKYIRQKQKYTEGESKWEFLDDMSFLDGVIHYRRKQWKEETSNTSFNHDTCSVSQSDLNSEVVDDCTNDSMPSEVPANGQIQTPQPSLLPVPDSTLNIINETGKKRRLSNNSEISHNATKKVIINQKRIPEEIFGELVAVMLAAKPDNEKNLAMMEIMVVLTRPAINVSK